uniref:Uncharacterized protein n=1 Tax=Timema monikensis TaxID=170555 RepID=A0A7R9E0J3_9NEOP|nr:unnamed protein product [Timema monikensis]
MCDIMRKAISAQVKYIATTLLPDSCYSITENQTRLIPNRTEVVELMTSQAMSTILNSHGHILNSGRKAIHQAVQLDDTEIHMITLSGNLIK